MAVLEIVDGLTAEILINGEPAHEYDDPDEVEVKHENHAIRKYQIKHTVSKYIESESGQNFRIRMTVGRPLGHAKMAHPKLTMDVEVDGILVWTLIFREFAFLRVDTSSDVTQSTLIKRQTERMKKRGTIVVKVYNSNAGRSGGPQVKIPQGNEKGFLERSQATVSEKL
ncbi:hypothetical protein IFR04_002673 [Cadophora malorum]|uniref:DUF7918 domain-containing protein n=1 Tax=Cadophora malorum TaxID=108018 RepID=A0A8H8BUF7_9HELO|nr:hypothetical protein IFR04_002673 [Cadophora malorum]